MLPLSLFGIVSTLALVEYCIILCEVTYQGYYYYYYYYYYFVATIVLQQLPTTTSSSGTLPR